MSEPETHDFMSVSVDSFSQLPFIRPTPARDKHSSAIRLFGFDFPHDPNSSTDDRSNVKETPTPTPTSTSNTYMNNNSSNNSNNNNNSNHNNCNTGGGGGSGDGAAGRKFECHYCCRNFPTSQALGGHQNAHKRERQHAKRAHLQSAMAAHHHHHAAMLADGGGNVYGLLNYHRLGSVPSADRFEPPPPTHYPSWTSTNPSLTPVGARFYAGIGSMGQPINGSPLPGLWRMPSHGGTPTVSTAYRDRSVAAAPLPLFGGEESTKVAAGAAGCGGRVGSSSSSSSSSSSTSQERGGYGSSGKNSVISLDLHL